MDLEVIKPGEQLDHESDQCYDRFMIYLHLGPGRSLDLAAQVERAQQEATAKLAAAAGVTDLPTPPDKAQSGPKQAKRANAHFRATAVKFEWARRARAWDIEQFKLLGYEGIIQFMEAVNALIKQLSLAIPNLTPKTWKELTYTIRVLSKVMPPPEIIWTMYLKE